jgi:hypothetical protein
VQPDSTISTLGSLLASTLDLTGLLVKLPAAHLLLQSASLHQFAEPSYRILDRLPIADLQLNHASLSDQTLLALDSTRETACSLKIIALNDSPAATSICGRSLSRTHHGHYRRFGAEIVA